MHYTVEALLHGKEKVLEYYENAKGKWKELFDKGDGDVESWSEWIADQSSYFEENCGGRLMSPEIMAWSAFGALYSIQFGWRDHERQQARALVKAIERETSSAALKAAAKQAAAFYALEAADKSSSGTDAAA